MVAFKALATQGPRWLRMGLLAGFVALASGCAHDLYSWGGYDRMLYNQYKDPTQAEAMRVGLTEHLAALEQANLKVGPGLYAELGTLYLERGDAETAIGYYEREKQAWPESAALMSVMIKNLQRTGAKTATRKTANPGAATATTQGKTQ